MFYFFLNKKITNSRLIIGGSKKGSCPPHLNYWERVPGLPPRVYAYDVNKDKLTKLISWTPEPRFHFNHWAWTRRSSSRHWCRLLSSSRLRDSRLSYRRLKKLSILSLIR